VSKNSIKIAQKWKKKLNDAESPTPFFGFNLVKILGSIISIIHQFKSNQIQIILSFQFSKNKRQFSKNIE